MKNIRKIIFGSLFLLWVIVTQNLLNGRPIYDREGNRRVMDSSGVMSASGIMGSVMGPDVGVMSSKSREEMQPGYITDYNLMEEYRKFNPEGYEQYQFGDEEGLLLPFDEYEKFMKSRESWLERFFGSNDNKDQQTIRYRKEKIPSIGYISNPEKKKQYRLFNPEGYKQYKNADGTLKVPFDEYQRFLKSDEYQNFLKSKEFSWWKWLFGTKNSEENINE